MATDSAPQIGPFPGVLHASTKQAIELMKNGKPGDEITKAKMEEAIGRSCSHNARPNGMSNVRSAIEHVIQNHGKVWDWVRETQSWRCLSDEEVVRHVEPRIKKQIRRRARKLQNVAITVRNENLPPDLIKEHSINLAQAKLSHLFSSGNFAKQLEKANGSSRLLEPDPAKVIALMKQES